MTGKPGDLKQVLEQQHTVGKTAIRGCIQKFPDWVDNEIYAYNNKHSSRRNIEVYGGKAH
jgi:hypothetical protein